MTQGHTFTMRPKRIGAQTRLLVIALALALTAALVGTMAASADHVEYWADGDFTRNNGSQTWTTTFDTRAGTMEAERLDAAGVYWTAEIACTYLVDENTMLFGGPQLDGDRSRGNIFIKVYDGEAAGEADVMWIATGNDTSLGTHCGGNNRANGWYGVTEGDLTVNVVSPSHEPQAKEECKKGGWQDFGFRNQGLCIQFVNTGKDSR